MNKFYSKAWDLNIHYTQKIVILALSFYCDKDGFSVMSMEDICLRTGASKRSIQGSIKELIEKNLIKKFARKSENGGSLANKYQILL